MTRRALALTAVMVLALVPVTAGTAMAASSTNTKDVSCDATITSTLVTLYHNGGTVSYKQVTTSPAVNRYNWATSSTGNSLSAKATANGQTVSWTSVGASNYTFKTHNVSSSNCNGILPGDGNTSLTYTATTA